MISSNRIITVSNGKSKIDEPIIVYRGDYELKVTFTILNNQFEVTNNTNLIETENAAFGQLAILTPYGGNIFTSMTECTDGAVSFLLSKEMLDQIEEVGLYSFQIRLFDYNEESRVSIPPVEFGMEVREPIASEDHDNTVDNAIVGYSIARIVDLKEDTVMPTFDLNGNYNKTNWETGDRITEKKLNKIEDAIDKINDNEMNDVAALSKRINNNFNVLDSTKADIFDVNSKIWSMANMGQDVKEAMTGGSVAVVGENTILNENIVDRQIRMEKLANDYEYYVADNGEFGHVDESGNINNTNGNNTTWTTEFIPVEEGKKYIIQCHYDGEHRLPLATYDSNKTIIKWELVDTNKLIVFTPSVGVSFIRMSMMTVDKGTFRLIPVTNIGREVLNNDYEYYVADNGEFGHVDESGNITGNNDQWTTAFIPVEEGKKYIIQCHYDGKNKLPLATYDSNKTMIKWDLIDTNKLIVFIPSVGVSFIRMSMMSVDKGTFRLIPVTNIGREVLDYEYYVADKGEFGNVDESGNINNTNGNNATWTTEFIPVEEGKKYIIQCHYDGEHRLPLATYDSNKTIIKWDLIDTNKLIVFTPSRGASFIRMSMMTVDKETFRLTPVTNIGEVLDYEYYVADNGEFGFVDESGNIKWRNDVWTTAFIPVEEGKNYIIQCHYDGINRLPLATYDSNKTMIKYDLVDTNKLIVFTPSKGASFIRMSMMIVDKGTFRLIPVTNIGRDVNTITGLKINFLGDSITQGAGTTKTYLQFLQEKFGVESRNYGISGSSISDLHTPMFSRALTMDEDADYVFVFGGTNDFNGGVSLGKLYTLSDSTKIATNDTSTFYGALHTLCVNLINRYPDKKIVLMTPIHREHFGGQPTEFQTNAQGLYLTDYVNAIKEVGEWYSIPVLDLYATSGLNPNIPIHKEKFFSPTDGLHPKAEGHEVIANRIKAFLNTI